jgi:hypothetical protein
MYNIEDNQGDKIGERNIKARRNIITYTSTSRCSTEHQVSCAYCFISHMHINRICTTLTTFLYLFMIYLETLLRLYHVESYDYLLIINLKIYERKRSCPNLCHGSQTYFCLGTSLEKRRGFCVKM